MREALSPELEDLWPPPCTGWFKLVLEGVPLKTFMTFSLSPLLFPSLVRASKELNKEFKKCKSVMNIDGKVKDNQ